MHSFSKEVSSYFDVPTRKDTGLEPALTPVSPTTSPTDSRRRPPIVIHSDWQPISEDESIHKRIYVQTPVQTVLEDSPSLDHQLSSNPPLADDADVKTLSKSTKRNKAESSPDTPTGHAVRHPSHNSDSATPSIGLTPSKESRPSTPRRPRPGHEWSRTVSGSIWIQSKKSSMDTEARRPSNQTMSSTGTPRTPGSGNIAIRTDQTPLRPPMTKNRSTMGASESSSITVETYFPEQPQKAGKTKTPSDETPRAPSSRKSSINPKRLFSAPLLYIRRASSDKDPKETPATPPTSPVLPKPRAVRLGTHPNQLKRNYTAEALQRVSAILQDTTKSIASTPSTLAPPSPGLLRPPMVRTFSDRPPTSKDRGMVHTAQGIVSQLSFYHRKSVEQLPGVESYTSSQLSLRLGLEPANTPEEHATYKVKRSPSAETEEFLKIDISVRGGTSYLPSEARRIHTPPIPEAGADGKWRGFFFDYNAPAVYGSSQSGSALSTGSASSGSCGDEGSKSPLFFKDLGKKKCKRSGRVVSGDWYDVKLKQLEAEVEPAKMDRVSKCGEKRLNTQKILTKAPPVRADPQFNMTIPEHLPSSPLCPRHPRYWRVVKGKGGQFRGC
ncbi:hypothetical protein LTS07_006267 [Exophiala sideris]|uniref:Uncharacterized protein n=1 Tax=Exophiala sideris TaxID=1016849 RepID=A0ABR0J784_9EURO|nr:hypothetical protein LTS07_006267 [Exophiala sideris]KAK5035755.1 hypothetical protein LTR13_005886 [Exophiala sideris]KAK5057390.1 hypothetical protein LTR69_007431 [Exophiala sideris]KAK5181634.1 hypothetical protein LTR44_005833 [Eurotiomycetes sp. CCFEE 6388]